MFDSLTLLAHFQYLKKSYIQNATFPKVLNNQQLVKSFAPMHSLLPHCEFLKTEHSTVHLCTPLQFQPVTKYWVRGTGQAGGQSCNCSEHTTSRKDWSGNDSSTWKAIPRGYSSMGNQRSPVANTHW